MKGNKMYKIKSNGFDATFSIAKKWLIINKHKDKKQKYTIIPHTNNEVVFTVFNLINHKIQHASNWIHSI